MLAPIATSDTSSMSFFWRQFRALFVKNWIVIIKHPIPNLIRCLIFPIAYGILLAYAQNFFASSNNYGLGTPITIASLKDHFNPSRLLVWVDATNGGGIISANDVMSHVTNGFSSKQLASVKQLDTVDDLSRVCVANFNGASQCFATVTFDSFPTSLEVDTIPINYTLRYDRSNSHIDVQKHDSAIEVNILSVQWALDKAIVELTTGTQVPTPQELPFTWQTNDDNSGSHRINYLALMSFFLAIPFFLAFVGIAYQLAGGIALERAAYLTSHMKAMGLLDSARILSWHISLSLAYLPSWIILAMIWKLRIFTATNAGLVIAIHLLAGLSLASWSIFVATPFAKSPQLASVVASGMAVVLTVVPIMLNTENQNSLLAGILSFFFPSMFYVFALQAIVTVELRLASPSDFSFGTEDVDINAMLLPMIIAALLGVIIWPCLAVLLERSLYSVPDYAKKSWWSFKKKRAKCMTSVPDDVAVSLQNVGKTFQTSRFGRKTGLVTAIENLTIDIPNHGIFVLLGPNGAGKSTALSILSGLTGLTSGTVTFKGDLSRPARGTLGIVPQKNVLFPELSCLQTLRVWNAIKAEDDTYLSDDLEQLLRDCNLQAKIHTTAGTMSGGQKRKLQLAIGLVGGSKLILVDECTSGVDPLSRRALWKTLTAYRNERTIILTTHHLDEADFLADRIAVLAAPGKLVAEGTPVALKASQGDGYSVQVTWGPEESTSGQRENLLSQFRTVSPDAYITGATPLRTTYHLKTRDLTTVSRAIDLLDSNKAHNGVGSYEVLGTSIEDIFMEVTSTGDVHDATGKESDALSNASHTPLPLLSLTNGRRRSPWAQALTIFHKRALIARRSWLIPLLALAVGISGSWWPLRFISGKATTCVHSPFLTNTFPLYPPRLYGPNLLLINPPSLVSTVNITAPAMFTDFDGSYLNPFRSIPENQSFFDILRAELPNFSVLGGISLDLDTGNSLVAWEIEVQDRLGFFGLATNLLYNHALNVTIGSHPTRSIIAHWGDLPIMESENLLTLRWVAVFGAAMVAFPALFAIYVTKERHSSVQAMQLSNGLADPMGLWLGHLLFDTIPSVIIATVVCIVFATLREKFQGIGYLWFVMVLYGMVGTLFAYLIAIFVRSPLAAFSVAAGTQFVLFLLYLVGYVVTTFSALPFEAPHILSVVHFTLSLTAPIASLTRAALLSVNLFSLLCDGDHLGSRGTITRYGGPILYLIMWMVVLIIILGNIDSGAWSISHLFAHKSSHYRNKGQLAAKNSTAKDVATEVELASSSNSALRVVHITKSYNHKEVVDDVSLVVASNSVFAMLGPNGAGKTTTFDIIRGNTNPDGGDVIVNNTSVLLDLKTARLSLGVCPQFTAVDAQLSVREHLLIYGRLKGLYRGQELQDNVNSLLNATSLDIYADRLANKLSGGNQRKLSLAIALLGNPSVILVDEFSTGIDAKMKRELWRVLKHAVINKAVLLTTHSMEEASALATKVGIMSKKMLAVGSVEELEARYATYEVHFSCHNREDSNKVQVAMLSIPGSRMVDGVATRFEVPIGTQSGSLTLSELFRILAVQKDFPEFTVAKSTLETAFIRVINEGGVDEEDTLGSKNSRWRLC
ncbi:hypothetical protein BDQ12DRAFT_677739 [Crucibulum laeve]|uniref:ABC transporter domain-containing protein n=1 Tax=Crucibulum laeve TaxID=68775 RepID=A0A5C3MLY8_9AGAR|nr:hypothetical protein BDQ12DRAFT_677739 [Crucibulum laeve]